MTNLDIDQLTRIVERELATRRARSRSVRVDSGATVDGSTEWDDRAQANLEEIEDLRDGTGPYAIRSHRRRLGPMFTVIKRLIHSALRPFLRVALDKQRRFNESVHSALVEVARRNAALEADLAEQKRSLSREVHEVARQVRALCSRTESDPEVERALEGLRKLVDVRPAPASGPRDVDSAAPVEDAELYARFHERASGFETSCAIFRQYVPRFTGCRRVVDLACGRGPFLTVLGEVGVPGYGVDTNPLFVREVRERGLRAVEGDALEHLGRLEEGSVDGAFAGHLVEHLGPAQLARFFRLVWRALSEGGVFVFETPNTEDLGVLAHAYFRDPTHRLPLHPDTYLFLAEACGFEEIEVEHSLPLAPEQRLHEIPRGGLTDSAREALNENVRRLNDLLYGPMNFALVCRKRSGEA